MSDKFYVGLDITGFENNGTYKPISRVTLWVDDENCLTAGDDTGIELEADCPHATQEMVDTILSSVNGYTYQAYSAEAANIDPAAELGDGVTVNGIYSVLSRINDDGSGYPGLSAPGEEELEDEYPSAGPMTQELNRKIAETRSRITKTASEIKLEVEDTVKGLSSSISVELNKITARVDDVEDSVEVTITTLDGLTVTDSNGTTKIKGSSVETGTLYVDAAHINGTLEADQVNLTGAITWGDLAQDSQDEINGAYSAAQTAQNTASNAQNTANSAANTAYSAYSLASNASNTVSAWQYSGTTYIDGAMLMTGTVKASTLQGGVVGILNSYGSQIGYLSVGASTSTGLQLVSGGNLFLASASCNIQMEGGNMMVSCSYLYPKGSAPYLGYSGLGMWQAVYSYTGTIQTSDLTKKHDVIYGLDAYDDFFDRLRPISFLFDDGTSGRRHHGLGAQDVEQALSDCGLTSMDFAGLIKTPVLDDDGQAINGEYDYALRYAEFIPMLVDQVQKLKAKVHELEGNL